MIYFLLLFTFGNGCPDGLVCHKQLSIFWCFLNSVIFLIMMEEGISAEGYHQMERNKEIQIENRKKIINKTGMRPVSRTGQELVIKQSLYSTIS